MVKVTVTVTVTQTRLVLFLPPLMSQDVALLGYVHNMWDFCKTVVKSFDVINETHVYKVCESLFFARCSE
jgi:hypothetical protein